MRRFLSRLTVTFVALASMLGIASAQDTETITAIGQIGYRERIALTPGASATVKLSDISLQDVAAPVIAEIRFPLDVVPRSFEVTAAKHDFLPGHTYALSAAIHDVDGNLRWITDTVHQLDPAQKRTDFGLLTLTQVAGPQALFPIEDLIGGEWLVEDLNGVGVIDFAQTTLSFDQQGRVSGKGGCNQYTGTYQLSENTLNIGPVAITKMACPGAVSHQEQRFLDAIAARLQVLIDDTGALHMTSDTGNTLIARRK